jgi:uncharacterized tellurite resistance protein B-like protein
MVEFFPETMIGPEQAQAIAHGLYAVARADGHVHEREAALISEFYAGSGVPLSSIGELERNAPIEPAALALALPEAAQRRLFIKSALLLAYTDSILGEGESKTIASFAAALGISESEHALLTTQVKEYLLSQLTHLQNVQAAVDVARKLEV